MTRKKEDREDLFLKSVRLSCGVYVHLPVEEAKLQRHPEKRLHGDIRSKEEKAKKEEKENSAQERKDVSKSPFLFPTGLYTFFFCFIEQTDERLDSKRDGGREKNTGRFLLQSKRRRERDKGSSILLGTN